MLLEPLSLLIQLLLALLVLLALLAGLSEASAAVVKAAEIACFVWRRAVIMIGLHV